MLWSLVEAVDAALVAGPADGTRDAADLGPDAADLGPDAADLGPDAGDLGPDGGGGGILFGFAGAEARAGGDGLAVLPLGGDHPLDQLLGLVAPPEWQALGVATSGRSHALDGSRPPEPVRVTMVLDRSGASASILRRGPHATRLDEPPEGAVADACRRALDLPTAPPPATTAELWARWWLDHLVQATVERRPAAPVPGWSDAVALHPATFVAAAGVPPPGAALAAGAPAPEPAALGAAARALTDAWSWPRLRAAPGVSAGRGPAVGSRLAQWMDDGMFARWLLSSFPPLGDLLDACRSVLPESLADRVAAAAAVALAPGER